MTPEEAADCALGTEEVAAPSSEDDDSAPLLSEREAEVPRPVAQGMTNSLVAKSLDRSPRTVEGAPALGLPLAPGTIPGPPQQRKR